MGLSLFADNTTIIGERDEIQQGVDEVKATMSNYEEQNNEEKEEVLVFGSEEGKEIRMLGLWIVAEVGMRNRKRRGEALWYKVKAQLKHTRLSKRTQAYIFEACVESALLFDCEARTWYQKEIKNLQRWVDKCIRYLWSNKTLPPLRQM